MWSRSVAILEGAVLAVVGLGVVGLGVVGVAAVLLAAPPLARADGDPASDVLLGQNVFYPYAPAVAGSLQRTLNAETAAAAKGGFPIKVALIGSPVDLGVIPALFGKPQPYADFLEQEISFGSRRLLLVVMAKGYGVRGLPPAATRAAASLPAPSGPTIDELAAAAIAAVPKLAAAAGHPVHGFAGASGSGARAGGGSSGVIIAIAAVVTAVVAAGGIVLLRRRHARG